MDTTDQREQESGRSAPVSSSPLEANAEAGAEDLCSLSAAVKRLKVFRRCQSLFELRLWVFFFFSVLFFCFTRCTTL